MRPMLTDERAVDRGYTPVHTIDELRAYREQATDPSILRAAWRQLARRVAHRPSTKAAPTTKPRVTPRARAPRTRAVGATSCAKGNAAPDGDGDPDAVSPELGRFLDWLADEAVKEMVRR